MKRFIAQLAFRPTDSFLSRVLLSSFWIHAAAMLSMVLLLVPGLPGTGTTPVQRVEYVANHFWRWRLGWLEWQLTAACDLLLALALVATSWIPRGPALVTLLITLVALVPDQGGQFLWVTRGVHLAQEASATQDPAVYAPFEARTFLWVGGLGCIGYLLGALGWTWCLAEAGAWSRTMSFLSIATWGTFAIGCVLFFLPFAGRPGRAIAACNAIGFVLLEFWFLGAVDRVRQRHTFKIVASC